MSHTKIRALLIDDELVARMNLRGLLKAHPQVEVVGEAASVSEAVELCKIERPDVLFLDVQMPREDGFDLLAKLDYLPHIIFVTAHERFALEAFEVNAIDYLTKPVQPERLAKAVTRVSTLKSLAGSHAHSIPQGNTLFLMSEKHLRVTPTMEVIYIEAAENYSTVFLADGTSMMIRRKMTEWQEMLPAEIFVRPHRSLIINISAILEMKSISRDLIFVTVKGHSTPLKLNRLASLRLREILNKGATQSSLGYI